MDCENFVKIPGTDLDEQYVAFALIEQKNFFYKLLKEKLLTQDEYHNIFSFLMEIENRCGFNQGDDIND